MTKKAFIVAVANYAYPNALLSPLNDLNNLGYTLQAYKGYTSFTTLTNENATRSNIISQLTSFVTNSSFGDKLGIAFYGHGSRLPGPEPDGWSECICPIDVFINGPIMDYELEAILSLKPPGVEIEVILGCCYAGDGTNSKIGSFPNKISRKKNYRESFYMEIPNNLFTLVNNKSSVPVEDRNHVLWAACKPYQTSWGGYINGKYQGIFNYYLCAALRSFPIYSRSQIDIVVNRYVTAWINKYGFNPQEPQCEATSLKLSQVPFI